MELFRTPISHRRLKIVARGPGSIGANVSYDGEHADPKTSWMSVGPFESPDGKYRFDLRMTLAEAQSLSENLRCTFCRILKLEDNA